MNELVLLHAGALGDCVLALHAARWVAHHRALPVIAFTRSSFGRFAQANGDIAHWQPIDALTNSSGRGHSQVEAILAQANLVIDFSAAPMGYQCNSSQIIRIDPQLRSSTTADGAHITRQWLLDIAAHIPLLPVPAHAYVPGPINPSPIKRLDGPTKVIIHPGSGGQSKCVPLPLLEQLATLLAGQGADVQWMIGPDERERDGIALQQRLAQRFPVIYREAIADAAACVAACHTYIGHDAGMTHVAAWTGTRTIAFFGPTDPAVWGPIGPEVCQVPFPSGPDDAAWVDRVAALALQNC